MKQLAFAKISYIDDEKEEFAGDLANKDTVSQFSYQLSELFAKRRSVKLFDRDFHMPDSHIKTIVRAASLAPSAFNIQHWRVVRIVSKDVKEQFYDIAWKQPQIISASELLVVCMDLQAWTREPFAFCHAKTESERDKFISMLNGIYSGNPRLQRDEALRSTGLFCMLLMLKAESMGYQSCPMSGFNYQKAATLLALAEGIEPCMVIAIGKADKNEIVQERTRMDIDEFMVTDHF